MHKRTNAKHKGLSQIKRRIYLHSLILGFHRRSCLDSLEAPKTDLAIPLRHLVVVKQQRCNYAPQFLPWTQYKKLCKPKEIGRWSGHIFKIQPGNIYVVLFGVRRENNTF